MGRAVAEAINAEHKHALIEEMDTPMLAAWVATSGFSVDELAMIQPMYCGTDPEGWGCVGVEPDEEEKMSREAEMGVMALNAGAAAVNGFLAAEGRSSYVASGAGLALGATGLAMGLSDRANYQAGDLALAGASLLLST